MLNSNDLSTSLLDTLTNPIKSITHLAAKSSILTALLTLAPMVAMFIITLFFQYNTTTFNVDDSSYRTILLSPIYVIASITWIAGFAALIAMRCKIQYVLRICSFVYAAIAYWCIINILILVFTAWSYLEIAAIGHIFVWSSLVTCIWLLSSSVMNTYGEDMSLVLHEMV